MFVNEGESKRQGKREGESIYPSVARIFSFAKHSEILLGFYLFDLPKNHFSDIIQTENKMDAQKNPYF